MNTFSKLHFSDSYIFIIQDSNVMNGEIVSSVKTELDIQTNMRNPKALPHIFPQRNTHSFYSGVAARIEERRVIQEEKELALLELEDKVASAKEIKRKRREEAKKARKSKR